MSTERTLRPSRRSGAPGGRCGCRLGSGVLGGASPVAVTDGPVLEVRHLTKRFSGVVACEDVDLVLAAGEVVALAGHNGAGKSTVLKMLSGVLTPDAGEIRVAGESVRLHSVRSARAHGIETVPQELALAPKLTVAANIFLGRELLARPSFLRLRARRRMETECEKMLAALGARIPRMRAKVGSLSGGQARRSRSPGRSAGARAWSCSTSQPRRSVSMRPNRWSKRSCG